MSSQAGVFVSVNFAPPPLPVYEQPECPNDGYLWTPGYWGYGPYGYYWVPGTWVQPPGFGLLWTPGYWGYGSNNYYFHSGYWGPQVGFYGGIDYGFGYGGNGYYGGRWQGGHFFYNTAVNRVNVTNIRNVYVNRAGINQNRRNVSFNGGRGGINASPTEEQRRFSRERHVEATSAQVQQRDAASHDRRQFAKENGGKPGTLASQKPDSYQKTARDNAKNQPLTGQDKTENGGPKNAGGNVNRKATSDDKLPNAKEAKPERTHDTMGNNAGPKKTEHRDRVPKTEQSRPRPQPHVSHPQQHAQQHASRPQGQGGPKPQGGGNHKGDGKDKH